MDHTKNETNLARLRHVVGFTQADLSVQSGVSLTQIKRMETRDIDINNVSAKNAVALATALGVDVKDLLEAGDPEN